jgi:hypothetical protein
MSFDQQAFAKEISAKAYAPASHYVQSGAHLEETIMGHFLYFDRDGRFQIYSTSKLPVIFGAVALDEQTTSSPAAFTVAIKAALEIASE